MYLTVAQPEEIVFVDFRSVREGSVTRYVVVIPCLVYLSTDSIFHLIIATAHTH